MADRTGFIVPFTVVTSATTDTYPVALANDIEGGLHSVGTLTERDNIFDRLQKEGMLCYVESDKKTYQLRAGVWYEFTTEDQPVIHPQATPSDTWDIQHNLGRYPETEVLVNVNGSTDVWANPTVEHKDTSRTILRFVIPFAGKAQLK